MRAESSTRRTSTPHPARESARPRTFSPNSATRTWPPGREPSSRPMAIASKVDVLIFAEHLEGRIAPSTFEAIAIGRELGSRPGGQVRVALFGEKVRGLAGSLAGCGVEVLLVEDS